MSGDRPFFLSQNQGFAPINAKDELLHPEQNRLVKVDSLAETHIL